MKAKKNTIIILILTIIILGGSIFLFLKMPIGKMKIKVEKPSNVVEEKQEENNIEEDKKEEKEEKIVYYTQIKTLEDAILNGTSDKKIAYLTFDDGPYYNTYKVLDILDEYNVKATFFTTSINGTNCYDKKSENCLNLYQEYIKRGHTIANHTFTHGIRKGLYKSADSFIEAVKKQEDRVKEYANGYITNIVRFPGGSSQAKKLKDDIIQKLRENNYGWVDWTAEDGDGKSLSSKEEAWNTFTKTIDEDIEVVLFHDYSRYTTEILPDAINYLRSNGYELYPLFYESSIINK